MHARTIASAVLLVVHASCASDSTEQAEAVSGPPTYYQDMLPLFAEHCLACHREGGIAPLRLDQYAEAKQFAGAIEQATRERRMPPWAITSDGQCGQFRDSLALSTDEIARIAEWVRAGAQDGTARELEASPPPPALAYDAELETPEFQPEAQGGELALHDEYRCFPLQLPAGPMQFITAYEVVPGTPELVHHVIVEIVNPADTADDGSGRTNAEVMRALDAASPEREGWPCFSGAGPGVKLEASPVVWAPGQGIVRYPAGSGVALLPGRVLVAQFHYNLAGPDSQGLSDQTKLRFALSSEVENVGFFALLDPLIESLDSDTPITLPAARASTTYSWQRTGAELGLDTQTTLQLQGIMPHMHELGRKYRLSHRARGEPAVCAADVQRWDFHWQRMYFLSESLPITLGSELSVSCEYDTSSVTTPVRPGWGTRNEMCSAIMYFTLPRAAFGL